MKLKIAILVTCSILLGITGQDAVAIEVGESAPSFTLEALDGKKVSLDDLKGKVVYLDFWASWCGPCRFSLPYMNGLVSKYSQDDFVVLAVNLDSNRAKAENALRQLQPNYTILLDPTSSVPALYDPPKMPSSFIVGRDGKVSAVHVGFNPDDTLEIENAITVALKGTQK